MIHGGSLYQPINRADYPKLRSKNVGVTKALQQFRVMMAEARLKFIARYEPMFIADRPGVKWREAKTNDR
jgi:hypothetical protein